MAFSVCFCGGLLVAKKNTTNRRFIIAFLKESYPYKGNRGFLASFRRKLSFFYERMLCDSRGVALLPSSTRFSYSHVAWATMWRLSVCICGGLLVAKKNTTNRRFIIAFLKESYPYKGNRGYLASFRRKLSFFYERMLCDSRGVVLLPCSARTSIYM